MAALVEVKDICKIYNPGENEVRALDHVSVSIQEKEFVAMPSYMVKQNGKDGKSQYQDVCFPVTKEFREKLYDALMECYQQEKEKAMSQGMEQAASQSMARAESRQPDRELPFR